MPPMNEFKELTITLPDGYDAYARYWPADDCQSAALHIHGIQSHCGWYEDAARALARAGIAVLQPDRRGSGRNRNMRGHADSPQQIIDDALACVDRLRELTGVQRIHLIGVSWGGKLVASVHVTDPAIAQSLTLIAPGIFPIIDVSGADKFRIGLAMLSDPSKHFDIPLNDPELFTDNPERISYLQQDEYQIHQATAACYLASRRMDRICSRISKAPPVPLHVYLAGDEHIIDNDKTREWVRDLAWPNAFVTMFERSRHTIEFGADRSEFLGDLAAWLLDPTGYQLGKS